MLASACSVSIVLSALVAVTEALLTGPQPKEWDDSSCSSPFSRISYVSFSWQGCPGESFTFWSRDGDRRFYGNEEISVFKPVFDSNSEVVDSKYGNIVGLRKDIQKYFAKVNPFAHLVEDITSEFGRPLREEQCHHLFAFIEGHPPEGYNAGSGWIREFVHANVDDFLEDARRLWSKVHKGYGNPAYQK